MSESSNVRILVCINERFHPSKPSCKARGSAELAATLTEGVSARSLRVTVQTLMCFGRCELGVNGRIAPGGRFFHGATKNDVEAIIAAAAAVAVPTGD